MRYNRENDCIEMSVAELCALANRRGDLNVRRPRRQWLPEQPTPDTDAPAAGEPYRQNVTLRNRARLDTPQADAVTFSVSGRADGVLYDPAGMSRVELTRTAAGNLQARAQYPDLETLAQLCTLGYFLCAARDLPQVTLRPTYVHAGGDASAESEQIMTAERLRAMYVAMLAQVLPRAADLRDRQGRVRDLLAGGSFPYPTMRGGAGGHDPGMLPRHPPGQTLFAQAPTGIGKTVSTLYRRAGTRKRYMRQDILPDRQRRGTPGGVQGGGASVRRAPPACLRDYGAGVGVPVRGGAGAAGRGHDLLL